MGSAPVQGRPTFVLLNGAHRVFKGVHRTQHGNRLLTAMLGAPTTNVFASTQAHALSPQLVEACPTRMLSADAWNQLEREKRRWSYGATGVPIRGGSQPPPVLPVPPAVLPNSFVLQHGLYGSSQPFVARPFEVKTSVRKEGADEGARSQPAGEEPPGAEVDADPALTRRILQEVRGYDSPSMLSIVSFLSAEFPKDAIQKAIDSLEKGVRQAIAQRTKVW